MGNGNQKWILLVALAAIPAAVTAMEHPGNSDTADPTSTSDDSPAVIRSLAPSQQIADDPLPAVRHLVKTTPTGKSGSAASSPSTVTADTRQPVLDETLTLNEAAAAGMRGMLNASREEVLKHNLSLKGMRELEDQHEAGPSFDLKQVVEMAVTNYPSIRSAMASVGQQQAGVDVARAGYFPTVQVGMTTGHQGVYGGGHAASASVSQMLFDFGKVKNAVASAQSSVHSSELQVQQEIDRIATQAALISIELQRYTSLEASARGQLDAVSKLLELAKKRAALGASNQADPAQAEARVSAAQATLLQIKNQVDQQRTALETLIGRKIPAGGVVIPPEMLKQATSGIPPGVEHTVSVQLAESQKEAAAADLAQAKSNTLPTFSVQAGVNQYLGTASRYFPGGREYTMTLGVTHNIFTGGAATARVRGASEALRGADERINTEQLQAENDRRVYEQQMTSLSSRMSTLQSRRASIVETQKLYKEQYLSLGTRSLLDLLNSEAEIYQAESDEINARHDLWAAEISYLNTTGYMRDVFQIGNAS
ncbi:MAG TPA: TolC family protein [Paraburkholderia sp.]|jgi:adhesin transport system outer membrane protein